ncbi:hypothetical protein MSKU15_1013 [Komagataeibacter diospyri]|uniref:hypothetical protein n=1 Tax=Komagataeibacter diospyri TaxID=1932662 RepID=UPI00113E71BF|nr:hypothetical protein [Komagataeibacter diospyri]GCE89412.1 hypothetical protein MSKU15_1013 [Komagataeibacter diospyri]
MDKNTVTFSNRAMRRSNLHQQKKIKKLNIRTHKILESPNVLSLLKNPDETLKFLSEVRKLADDPTKDAKKRVDLSNLNSIDIGAALSFVAELDRWQRIKGIYLHPDTVNEWDDNIVSELNSLGFFELLKTDMSKVIIKNKSKNWIPFMSGTQTVGLAAKKLRIALSKILPASDQKLHIPIYVPLIESMKNSIEHAYDDHNNDISSYHHFGKRWWMAGSYNEAARRIEIAFLDLGVTIPITLPRSRYWPALEEDPTYGPYLHLDSARIRSAMLYRMSRTGEYQRGKGFKNILEPVYLHPKNGVVVNSRFAQCIVVNDGAVARESNVPFAGTLIKWYLHLPDVSSEDLTGANS